jgi:hypothetical protein
MTGPKEQMFDEAVAPLLEQIVHVCRRAGISVHASFALDEGVGSTTHVLAADAPDDFRLRYQDIAATAYAERAT